MKRYNYLLLFLFIVIFGLVLRLLFFTQIISGDDLEYYGFAHKITEGTFNHYLSFHSTRIGLAYPTALFYKIFGISEITSNLLPLLTSIASIILIFYIGKTMFNERVGLIAAFLLSFFPLNVFYSTTLFPDQPSAFFMALSVFLFLRAEKYNSKLTYVISGFSAGLAYLMKELSVLIFVFFFIYIVYRKNLKKEHFLILSGFFIVFALELMYYIIKISKPLFRYTIVTDEATNIMKIYLPNYFGIKVLSRLFLHYPYLILTNPLTTIFYSFIIISLAYCTLKRKKQTYILFIWILPLALYVNFGSLSFSEYVPLPADVRYTEIVTIPAILLLSYFVFQTRKMFYGLLANLMVIFLLATSIYFIATNPQRQSSENLYKAAEFLKFSPKKVIYTDPRSAEMLKYLFNFDEEYRTVSFNNYKALDLNKDRNNLIDMQNIHDSYLVVNWRIINALLDMYKDMEFPKEIKNPPRNWIEKFNYSNNKDKIVIYYIT